MFLQNVPWVCLGWTPPGWALPGWALPDWALPGGAPPGWIPSTRSGAAWAEFLAVHLKHKSEGWVRCRWHCWALMNSGSMSADFSFNLSHSSRVTLCLTTFSMPKNKIDKDYQHSEHNLIQSDPFWSILIQFIPIWSNLIKFVPSWSNLIQFDPIWSNLNQFV